MGRRATSPTATGLTFASTDSQTPGWAIPFGGEFWRRTNPQETPPSAARSPNPPPTPFNTADVIDRVTHAWAPDESNPARATVAATTYTATFDPAGLTFSPGRPGETASGFSKPGAAPQRDPATTVRFQTQAIRRGTESHLEATPPQWVATGNIVQGLRSAEHGIIEHYEAGTDGVAVSWILSHPLPGEGGIEVEMAIEGLSYAGASTGGHHFADAAGTARLRVGQATIVDANDTHWDVDTRVSGDGTARWVVQVPAAILDEAAYPLAIDPVISAEFGIDQPVSAPAPGSQSAPALAAGRGQYLLVWTDSRGGSLTGNDIFGVRISASGAVLDPTGIAICTTHGDQTAPSAAAFGNSYLVAWQDARLGGNDIFASLVSSAGAVANRLGFAVSTAPDDQAEPAVAASPSGFLVVWEDDRNTATTGRDIFGARVSPSGVVNDPGGLAICTRGEAQGKPTVTAFIGGFFTAWQDERYGTADDIFGTRITADGIVRDPQGIPVCVHEGIQTAPTVAANSIEVLVAWQDTRNGAADIYATRVDIYGDAVETNGIQVAVQPGAQTLPAAAAVGDTFLVAWQDARLGNNDIFAARLDLGGQVLDLTGRPIATNTASQVAPAVAGGAAGFFVAWADYRNSVFTGSDVFGTTVDPAGVAQTPGGVLVGTSRAHAIKPAVAFNGSSFLVVWEDTRAVTTLETNIYGARVSARGQILDPTGIAICTAPGVQKEPAVGASGSMFLVAWEDARNYNVSVHDIVAARIRADGQLLDPAGLPISVAAQFQSKPVVAGNDTTFLIAWEDSRNALNLDIYCAVLSTNGVISTVGGAPVTLASQNDLTPTAAATPNGFLLAWQRAGDILAARVSNSGAAVDPPGLSLRVNANGRGSLPCAAALGTNFLVTWADSRTATGTGLDIYAGRVNGDGSLPDTATDGFPVSIQAGDQSAPALASDGSSYVAVWQSGTPYSTELHSARINPAGTVLDRSSLPLTGSSGLSRPAIVNIPSGGLFVAAEAFRDGLRDVRGEFFTPDPSPSALIVQFGAPTFTAREASRFARIKVTLKGRYSGTVGVDFTTADRSAVAGADYLPVAGQIFFANRKRSTTIAVPIVADTLDESDESLVLQLTNPTGGAVLGPRHTVPLTITD